MFHPKVRKRSRESQREERMASNNAGKRLADASSSQTRRLTCEASLKDFQYTARPCFRLENTRVSERRFYVSLLPFAMLLVLIQTPRRANSFGIYPPMPALRKHIRVIQHIQNDREILDSRRQQRWALFGSESATITITTNNTTSGGSFIRHNLSTLHNGKTNGFSEAPVPTENGGYTHTSASRAKISAANKGKTPWNKGRKRSPEERARIAAGVRARNRERFLEKLANLNMTEAEWEEQEAEKKRIKAERVAKRRTEKGGYRPTEETRRKISRILKEKHARGEVRRSPVDPSKVRRGFKHSEETRRKISESLRKRWATDEGYRENMREKTRQANTKADTRRKISESLRLKWQDPEFREEMLTKIANRSSSGERNDSHRERISEAMKLKWQDEEYRKKTLKSIAKSRKKQVSSPANGKEVKTTPVKVVKKPVPSKASARASIPERRSTPSQASTSKQMSKVKGDNLGISFAQPLKARKASKKSPKKKRVAKKKQKTVFGESVSSATAPESEAAPPSPTPNLKEDGSVSRLREERRDLYDLLYGDEEESRLALNTMTGKTNRLTNLLGDENLETFDPYGLDDF